MGNRAVIATERKDIGMYMHWNGGRWSVESLLHYCKLKNYVSPDRDDYGWACLIATTRNCMDSVGVGMYDCLDTDNFDNGTYIIKDWEIIERLYVSFDEGPIKGDELLDNLKYINGIQPEHLRVSEKDIIDYVNEYEA